MSTIPARAATRLRGTSRPLPTGTRLASVWQPPHSNPFPRRRRAAQNTEASTPTPLSLESALRKLHDQLVEAAKERATKPSEASHQLKEATQENRQLRRALEARVQEKASLRRELEARNKDAVATFISLETTTLCQILDRLKADRKERSFGGKGFISVLCGGVLSASIALYLVPSSRTETRYD